MADMEVGKVSLGVEIEGQSIREQAPELEKAAEEVGKKGGESLNKGMRDKVKEGSKGLSNEFAKSGSNAGGSFLSKLKSVFGSGGKALIKMGAKLAAGMAAAFAAKKIFNFAKEAIAAGSDLEEVQNVVDVTFGKMNKTVDEFAQKAATTIGMSEKVAKQYMGTFGAMGKAFGFGQQEVYDMSKALTELTGDVASFYNLDQQEAFDKLKAVFTGETEGLKSLGVVMTQNALDSFAMANGFGKVTSQMSEAEKVSLRYQFVLAKLNDASGDFSRTSTGWANQTRMLSLQFESLKAAIGQGLIAALGPAIQALNRFMGVLVKAANAFKNFMQALFGTSAGAKEMGGAVTSALSDITGSSADAINGVTGVGKATSGAAKKAKKAVQDLKRTLEGFDQITKVQDEKGAAGGAGGAGGGGGGGAAGGEIPGMDASAFEAAADQTAGASSRLAEKIKKAVAKIRKVLESVKAYFVGWYNRYIKPTIESIKDTWDECVKKIKEGYDRYMKPTLGLLKAIWEAVIVNLVMPMIERVGRLINKLWEKVLKPIVSWLSSLLMPILSEVVLIFGTKIAWAVAEATIAFNAIIEVIDILVDAVGWVIEKVQDLIDWLGELPAVQNIAVALKEDGWASVAGWVSERIGGVVKQAVDLARNGWGTVKDWVSTHIGGAISKAIGLAKNWSGSVADWVRSHIGGAVDKAIGLSKSWSSVASWIKGHLGEAISKAIGLKTDGWSNVASWVRNKIGGTVSVGVSLFKSGWSSIKKFFGLANGGIVSNGIKFFKDGGRISGDTWKKLPKYAGGTSEAHGTAFIAGEDGAEIVGNVNGATEVLNKSQIAASVASGVARVISRAGAFSAAGVTPHLAIIESHAARQTASLEAMAARVAAVADGGDMRDVVTLLRDILRVLNEISDQPIYLDGQDIRKRIVNLINAHTQATGRCEIVT